VSFVVLAAMALMAAPAHALSEGRVYEMVSPPFKGGFGATHIEAVTPDGESVAYFSPGAFAGQPAGFSEAIDGVAYLARRGGSGWSTVPLVPPDSLSPSVLGAADVTPSLDSEVVLVQPLNLEEPLREGDRNEFVSHSTFAPDVSANWEVVGSVLETLTKGPIGATYFGASDDFCHVFFEALSEPLLPAAVNAFNPAYELVRGCNGESVTVRLVAVNNKGKVIGPSCILNLGGGSSRFNDISADGSTVFFTTCVASGGAHRQLFVRLGGVRTLEVSRGLSEACGAGEVPCSSAGLRAGADFAGASEDGSRVYFTTTASLTGEGDSSRSLYVASIGCAVGNPECVVGERVVTSLVRVSRGAGEAGDVQGVVRVAPDGSRVYFVARGVLDSGANAQGAVPVKGADNLYVYDSTLDSVGFVGELCSGLGSSGVSEGSGGVEDVRCPNKVGDINLWLRQSEAGEAQTAGVDGRFLVFSSYGQLVSGDTDSARDVYRYDAVSGVLDRVSGGEAGYDRNGNGEFDASVNTGHVGGSVRFQHEMDSRAVSEDGSRIVFTTAEPLSRHAVNGLSNVYEWRQRPGGGEGVVSLVSTGSAEAPVKDVVISADGRNVFFVTTQGLVPQDTDGSADVYDARLEGGFPPPPAERRPCEGDACQGPLTNPAPLLVPGSVSQAPGENLAAPAVTGTAPRKPAVRCAKGRKLRRGRCVKVNAKRRVRAGKAALGGRGAGL
jgi:hypothetical protein